MALLQTLPWCELVLPLVFVLRQLASTTACSCPQPRTAAATHVLQPTWPFTSERLQPRAAFSLMFPGLLMGKEGHNAKTEGGRCVTELWGGAVSGGGQERFCKHTG